MTDQQKQALNAIAEADGLVLDALGAVSDSIEALTSSKAGLKSAAAALASATAALTAAAPQPVPAPTPPTPVPVPSGVFSFPVDASGVVRITDPAGRLFIPHGVNVPATHGYWGGPFNFVGKAARVRKEWGWNIIRLFEQLPGGFAPDRPDAGNDNDIDRVIAECTPLGIVVMIDFQTPPSILLDQAWIDKAVGFWRPIAERHGANPFVWFNLFNEAEATFHSWKLGAKTEQQAREMMADRWYDAHLKVMTTIRQTGAKNMIVACDSQAGQGADNYWTLAPITGSAVIMRGADLVKADPLGQVMFDIHAYDQFGWMSPDRKDCAVRWADSDRDTRVRDYITRVHKTTGRPVLAGEMGYQVTDRPDSGVGFHAPYHPPCGSRTLLGMQAWLRVAREFDAGSIEWTGFQITSNGTDAYDHNNLTNCGRDLWEFGRWAAVRMAGTATQPAPTPVQPPTPAPVPAPALLSVTATPAAGGGITVAWTTSGAVEGVGIGVGSPAGYLGFVAVSDRAARSVTITSSQLPRPLTVGEHTVDVVPLIAGSYVPASKVTAKVTLATTPAPAPAPGPAPAPAPNPPSTPPRWPTGPWPTLTGVGPALTPTRKVRATAVDWSRPVIGLHILGTAYITHPGPVVLEDCVLEQDTAEPLWLYLAAGAGVLSMNRCRMVRTGGWSAPQQSPGAIHRFGSPAGLNRVTRSLITGGADGIQSSGDWLIEDSIITDLVVAGPDNGQGTHNDALDIDGGNWTVRRTILDVPMRAGHSNGCLFGQGTGISVLVEDSLLTGGCTQFFLQQGTGIAKRCTFGPRLRNCGQVNGEIALVDCRNTDGTPVTR